MRIKDVIGYIRKADEISIVMGAGASRTAGVPTAPSLVEQINKEFDHCLIGLSADERKDYGRVMGALSPGDRKSLIEPLLAQSRINWGHIALACIIKSTNVRRVLTFNFDLVLERSASLLGMHLPVYDFGVSPTRDIAGLAAPAIFHLHGQSYGLRQMNSVDETTKHKDALRPLLADSLRNHLTLVIGYSGEADPALGVMSEEFNSHKNLIWLGYSDEPKGHLSDLLAKDYTSYIGGCDFDRTMIEIAEGLRCWPPEVIKNPPLHILKELEEVVEYPVQAETGVDILTSTRKRLNQAGADWDAGKDDEARAQDALMSGTEQAPSGDSSKMSESERIARAWSAIRAGTVLAREAEGLSGKARAKKFTKAREKFAEALKIKPDMHEALYNWGTALLKEAKGPSGTAPAEMLAKAREKFAEALKIKPDKHEALYNWGVALSEEAKGLSGKAQTEKYAQAGEKYAEALKIKPDKHEALYNWGVALSEEAKGLIGKAQTEKYAQAGEKFAEALKIKPDKHETLSNWGAALSEEAKGLSGKAREEKLVKAASKLNVGRQITGRAVYNVACAHALSGDIDSALDELDACLTDGTLPTSDHLAQDEDMDPLRDEPRYKAIMEKLTQSE